MYSIHNICIVYIQNLQNIQYIYIYIYISHTYNRYNICFVYIQDIHIYIYMYIYIYIYSTHCTYFTCAYMSTCTVLQHFQHLPTLAKSLSPAYAKRSGRVDPDTDGQRKFNVTIERLDPQGNPCSSNDAVIQCLAGAEGDQCLCRPTGLHQVLP